MIQTSLRNELGPDVTLITVAHRLQTVMDADKIVSRLLFKVELIVINFCQMVLDAGRIVSEFSDLSDVRLTDLRLTGRI